MNRSSCGDAGSNNKGGPGWMQKNVTMFSPINTSVTMGVRRVGFSSDMGISETTGASIGFRRDQTTQEAVGERRDQAHGADHIGSRGVDAQPRRGHRARSD